MKTVIAIVVHSHFDHIHLWLKCWAQCNRENAEMVVIQNVDHSVDRGGTPGFDYRPLQEACEAAGVRHVRRKNIGFDIGAYQDIFNERLHGFPNDWNNIICLNDDVFPMDKNFVKAFTDTLALPYVGIACMNMMEGSNRHVQSMAFAVTKEVSKKMVFPCDPVTTKDQTYQWESSGHTSLMQVEAMGLKAKMICDDLSKSPIYDPHHCWRFRREAEFRKLFGEEIIPAKKNLRERVWLLKHHFDRITNWPAIRCGLGFHKWRTILAPRCHPEMRCRDCAARIIADTKLKFQH